MDEAVACVTGNPGWYFLIQGGVTAPGHMGGRAGDLKEMTIRIVWEKDQPRISRIIGLRIVNEAEQFIPRSSASGTTWNFRHIANVRIRREVERILANHGYDKTTIRTPEELF